MIPRIEQDIAGDKVFCDFEIFARPLLERSLAHYKSGNGIDALRCQACECQTVDECGRALVTHAGTGGIVDGNSRVRIRLAGFDTEMLHQPLRAITAAEHAVDNIVAETDVIPSAWLMREKTVESHDSVNHRLLKTQPLRQQLGSRLRDMPENMLDMDQDLQEAGSFLPPLGDSGFDRVRELGVRHLLRCPVCDFSSECRQTPDSCQTREAASRTFPASD